MTTTPETAFEIHIDQNAYLPEGGRDVHAIVTVKAAGGGPAPAAGPASVVIIIDNSSSMHGERVKAAKAAAKAAVEHLRDGTRFAVVTGTTAAKVITPGGSRLIVADERHRRQAVTAIGRIAANGGTAIGTWLRKANDLLAPESGIKQAILLTDGKNGENAGTFDRAIQACEGNFVCDCRGVGADWNVDELRKVSSALLGSVDIVAEPADLVADFEAMVAAAMGKAVADVSLSVWTPADSEIRFVKQVFPNQEDLTSRRSEAGPLTGSYPLGTWGDESRDYHVAVRIPPGEVGKEKRAAWIKLVAGDEVMASANVLARWTSDEALATTINPQVAHYTGQAELAEDIQLGLRARAAGDEETATARLGNAVRLAGQTGNEAITALLAKVVEVVDAPTGTVRLKRGVSKVDEVSLDTRSTKTVRTRPEQSAGQAGE